MQVLAVTAGTLAAGTRFGGKRQTASRDRTAGKTCRLAGGRGFMIA